MTTPTDRELLEGAARAAGFQFDPTIQQVPDGLFGCVKDASSQISIWWVPLRDDGDALRLAVKLGLFSYGIIPEELSAAFPSPVLSSTIYGTSNDSHCPAYRSSYLGDILRPITVLTRAHYARIIRSRYERSYQC